MSVSRTCDTSSGRAWRTVYGGGIHDDHLSCGWVLAIGWAGFSIPLNLCIFMQKKLTYITLSNSPETNKEVRHISLQRHTPFKCKRGILRNHCHHNEKRGTPSEIFVMGCHALYAPLSVKFNVSLSEIYAEVFSLRPT